MVDEARKMAECYIAGLVRAMSVVMYTTFQCS